jgi:hypothetical protein
VSPDITRHVSEPLANILDRYLPERAKKACEVGMDPCSVLLGMWSILSQCQANEKALVAQFLASREETRPAAPVETETAPLVDPGAVAGEVASFDVIGAEA